MFAESQILGSKALVAQNQVEEVWYVDAGATQHMTDRRDFFRKFMPLHEVNGQLLSPMIQNLWVEGTIIVHYIKRFVNGKWLDGSLHGVLHIPELRTKLFSIGKATDKGVVTTYHKDKCEMVIHEGKGDLLLTGSRRGKGLNKLNIHVSRNHSSSDAAGPSN